MTEYHYNNDELKSKLTTVSSQLKALADGYRDLIAPLKFLKTGKETRSFKDVMNCLFRALRAHGIDLI